MIISKRYSQNLLYFTFHMCWIHWYEKFASFRGSLSSLWLITCSKHHIALFSLYEFFPFDFSYKLFNEAISTQDYVISSIFSEEVFGGWYWDIWYIVLFSLYEFFLFEVSHIKFLMRQCQHKCYMLFHLVFPTEVFRRWYLKHIDHRVKMLLD